jgi:hypothetical protein
MQRAVRAEIDLIDVSPFVGDCDPGAYGAHLDRLYAGTPEARDVACLSALGDARTVGEVLDGAPLSGETPIETTRLRRSAASVLAALPADALPSLCARLGDPRDDVARVASQALAEAEAAAAAECIRGTLRSGSVAAKTAAIVPFRQLLARGALGPAEGWDLLGGLLGDADPGARVAGLGAASMFAFSFADPAARALLEDGDPRVRDAARDALRSIDAVYRTDLLSGHADP